jgi:hypothetical protein
VQGANTKNENKELKEFSLILKSTRAPLFNGIQIIVIIGSDY